MPSIKINGVTKISPQQKKCFLKEILDKKEIDELKEAFKNDQVTFIFLKLAEKTDSRNSKFLYSTVINLLKLNIKYLPSIEYIAYSYYKLGNLDKAVTIYQNLVDKNPDNINYRINLLNLYSEQKDITSIKRELSYIKDRFILNKEKQAKIDEIKKQYKRLSRQRYLNLTQNSFL